MSENTPSPEPTATSSSIRFEPDTPCEACGRFGAYRFADRALCDECVAGAGSCCPEFGKDDLWREHED